MPTTSTTPAIASDPMKKEITLTRILNAPRELVFKAWTNPKHLAQWWGPHGFTTPVCEMDVRNGGSMYLVMRPSEEIRKGMGAPEGTEFPMKGTFQEIVEPERIVFKSFALDQQGNALLESLTTVTFAEFEGKTKLTLHSAAVGLSPVAPQMLAGMDAGWTQSLERLADAIKQ